MSGFVGVVGHYESGYAKNFPTTSADLIPISGAAPEGITSGPGNTLWFAEITGGPNGKGAIGELKIVS